MPNITDFFTNCSFFFQDGSRDGMVLSVANECHKLLLELLR